MYRGLHISLGMLVGAISACAGELEHPERFALGIACDDPAVFVTEQCGPCHQPNNVLGTVDLVSPGLGERLIDHTTEMCDDVLMIDSTDPSRSYILDKLAATPTCGVQMPYRSPPLDARGRACVAAFVDQVLSDHLGPDAGTRDAANDSSL